jgi:hypothetical protein
MVKINSSFLKGKICVKFALALEYAVFSAQKVVAMAEIDYYPILARWFVQILMAHKQKALHPKIQSKKFFNKLFFLFGTSWRCWVLLRFPSSNLDCCCSLKGSAKICSRLAIELFVRKLKPPPSILANSLT